MSYHLGLLGLQTCPHLPSDGCRKHSLKLSMPARMVTQHGVDGLQTVFVGRYRMAATRGQFTGFSHVPALLRQDDIPGFIFAMTFHSYLTVPHCTLFCRHITTYNTAYIMRLSRRYISFMPAVLINFLMPAAYTCTHCSHTFTVHTARIRRGTIHAQTASAYIPLTCWQNRLLYL